MNILAEAAVGAIGVTTIVISILRLIRRRDNKAEDKLIQKIPHEWVTSIRNHRDGVITYMCKVCYHRHQIKPTSMFDTDQHMQLLERQVNCGCEPRKEQI